MATIQDYLKNAQLSVAAYANLQQGMQPTQYINALIDVGMNEIQAREFVGVDQNDLLIPDKGYEIVGQLPNTNNGFSATVFKKNGEYFLAIRGTEGFTFSGINDWLANVVDIGTRGIAFSQALDLFNYYQDLTAQAGSTVYHYAYNLLTNEITSSAVVASTTGVLFGQVFTVTGHSLGGHLALVMSRLAPTFVGPVYTYNAPGFDDITLTSSPLPGSEGFFTLLRNAEMSARGASTVSSGPWDTVNLHNVVVPEDAVHLIGFVPGLELMQFSELGAAASASSSHDKNAMADALAVYNLLAQIDPAKADIQILNIGTSILKAAANTAGATLETLVDAVGDLFDAGTKIDIGNRDQLYQRLIDLNTTLIDPTSGVLRPQYQGLSLWDVTSVDAQTIEVNASTDLAYRYGLKQLNSFVLIGNDTIYAPHNANGELDLYDTVNRTGTLTADWITDRAKLLFAELIRNTQDIADPQVAVLLPGSGDRVTEYHHYRGGKEEVFFAQPADSSQLPTQVVMFADDAGRLLTGTDNLLGDHLYGGADTDYLIGKANADSLEGGKGLDIYQYNGSGSTNDGADVIRDIDGKGVLRYTFTQSGFFSTTVQSTVIADASVRVSGLQWNSADGKFSYTRSQNDLIVTINDGTGGSFTLRDFRDGDFNIHLWEAHADPEITGVTITGDLEPQDFDPNTDGIQTQTDALGNVIVTANPEPDRNDVLNDSTGNDRIIAGGGNDILRGIRGGDDWMSGEAGRDNLAGGAGADLLEGGADGVFSGEAGGDIAYGDVGNDQIYADTKIALAEAITQGNTGAASNAKGDFLAGGAGDDWLIGAAANDALLGGGGQDLIVGGAGNDDLAGDLGYVATSLTWTATRTITPQPDGSNLHQIIFTGTSALDLSAGGNDVIYGGGGDDWILAGPGDDFIDAGPDNDKAWGEAGSDVMIGGAGNDMLIGDNPGFVTGAAEGGDYLDGGVGDDELFGEGGNDVLIGGPGNDTLNGGAGKDIYVFNKGDGTETVFDDDTNPNNPDASVLVLGDGVKKWLRLFEQFSPIYKWTPGELRTRNGDRARDRALFLLSQTSRTPTISARRT